MRIGIFADQYLPNISGLVTAVINSRRALEALGHEVFIIAPASKQYEADDDHVIRVRSINTKTFSDNLMAVPNRGAVAEIMALHLDVIHVQEAFTLGVLGVKIARRQGIPVVLTIHTQWDQLTKHYPVGIATGVLLTSMWYPLLFGLKQSLPMIQPVEDAAGPIAKQVWRNLVTFANATDVVISPSQHVAKRLQQYHCKQPVYALPNCLDMSRLRSVQTQIELKKSDPAATAFAIVGRVSGEKRQEAVIKAVHKSAQPVELFIIGDGPALLDCKQLVKTLGLGAKVHFVGRVDHNQVVAILSQADVFVLASHGFDNQPMVILEALAACKPILYCDPKLSEGLTPANAHLSGPSPTALARAIDSLAADPSRLTHMAEASRQLSHQFDIAVHGQKLVSIYQAAIAIVRSRS